MYPSLAGGSRTQQAVAVLTDLITSGQIASGEFLPPEIELCRRLGVSRATVREALRTLETRGLVQSRHGVGVQVSDETAGAVAEAIGLLLRRRGAGPRDMLEVRLMLECQSAALAAERATDGDLAALEAAIEAMHAADMTTAERVDADLDFHIKLAEAAKNEVLAALVHALRGLLRETIAATFEVDSGVDVRIDAHGRVLDAVRAHDGSAAAEAMRVHLLATEELVYRIAAIGERP